MDIMLFKRSDTSLGLKIEGEYREGVPLVDLQRVAMRIGLFIDCNWASALNFSRLSYSCRCFKDHLLLRGYSATTIKAYLGQVERFFAYWVGKAWDWKDNVIQNYSLQLLDRGFSHAYVNQEISTIKFYAAGRLSRPLVAKRDFEGASQSTNLHWLSPSDPVAMLP
ncbi:hypothetical protein ABE504_09790 [Paenibacillus oryzisoli]|uniref:hypothetical protein n=1 Tax=Paenibacillus oryzisoli TaxID=1850517 RepID=UPI003D296747